MILMRSAKVPGAFFFFFFTEYTKLKSKLETLYDSERK